MVATNPVDFRKGADGLAALVREQLRHDPFSGTIFVFRSKRADRLKILAWDGSGLVLLWKRLEQNAFRWPPISDGVMRLSASQLAGRVCKSTTLRRRQRHREPLRPIEFGPLFACHNVPRIRLSG